LQQFIHIFLFLCGYRKRKIYTMISSDFFTLLRVIGQKQNQLRHKGSRMDIRDNKNNKTQKGNAVFLYLI